MCNTGGAPVPRVPTKDDILGEDPWSNTIVDPAFMQDPTGIMRQSDVVAIDAINTALGTDAIRPASEMLGGFMGGGGASQEEIAQARYMRDSDPIRRMSPADYEAYKAAQAEAAAEEKRRVTAWQGENRSRRGRAATLLTGPRGLSSDGTTARRTLLAM